LSFSSDLPPAAAEFQQTAADPTTATKKLRFGVLGTGRITRRMVVALQKNPHLRVSAIASRDATRARWYADQYGIPHAFTGYETLLRSDEVDAVYLALPPSEHFAWGIAAAEHQKHLLCEKPLSCGWAQARDLDHAFEQHGRQWLDATAWLHHPRTAAMAGIIASGQLGTIRHLSAAVSFFEPFQSEDHRLSRELGGGSLLDLGWYAAGLLIWGTGGELPDRIHAIAVDRGPIDVRVSVCGALGDRWSTTLNCGYDCATRKWMEIAGDHASIVCDDFTRPWGDRSPRFWVHDRTGSVRCETIPGDQEAAMIDDFCLAIDGQIDLQHRRRQALATQYLIESISQAVRDRCEIALNPLPEFAAVKRLASPTTASPATATI